MRRWLPVLLADGPRRCKRIISYGRRRALSRRIAVERPAAGQAGTILTTYNDITARKQAEAEREQVLAAEHAARTEAEAALKIRKQFLSIAAHELHTPLTALIGFVDMLLTTMGQGPDQVGSLIEPSTRASRKRSFALS